MWTLFLLIPILFLLAQHHRAILFRLQYHNAVYRVKVARDIISFRRINVRTLGERLVIRALPNQRLIAAFGINNAFTTIDPWVHKRFVRYATELINRVNADNEEWRHLSLLGQDILTRYIVESGHDLGDQHRRLHLTSTVRTLCFCVVLHFLFPGVEDFDLQAARSVTNDINHLWVQSKDASRPVSRREQDRLVTKIRRMIPATGQLYDLSGREEQSNPLNIILPAFETLWRVVLLTYVHIAFRGIGSDGPRVTTEALARDILADLPSHLCTGSVDESTALMISKEALRLYPPTKRIHRAASHLNNNNSTPTACPDFVAVDIESIHRDTFIWGHNAHDFFLPRMGQGLTQDQKNAYMPFGLAPHLCPASNKFGERMIAMLLGVLFEGLGTRTTGTTIEYGNAALDGNLHAPLPTGREDAEGWHVSM